MKFKSLILTVIALKLQPAAFGASVQDKTSGGRKEAANEKRADEEEEMQIYCQQSQVSLTSCLQQSEATHCFRLLSLNFSPPPFNVQYLLHLVRLTTTTTTTRLE